MEINTAQTQIPAITPLQTPEETVAPAEETNTTETVQSPAATEAYRISISAEARAEEETTASSTGEETPEPPTQEETEQLYTHTGQIA